MSANFEDEYTEEISEPCPEGRGVNMEDFVAYMPAHFYIFTPCREPWVGASVNSRLPRVPVLDQNGRPKYDKHGKPITISPTSWLDRNRPVEQMTWAPGLPMTIKDRLVADGGWIERKDVNCLNLYRPPRIEPGDAAKAGPWLDHIQKNFDSDDAAHCIHWLAHRVQLPQDKINHALVLGGAQGIGKDTMLEPLKHAVGPWNFHEVSPGQLLGRFNSFAKSVILRVNEARDLGDVDRFSLYDHTKIYTAAPPDVLRVDEKHLREHYVFNCLGFIVTTNHKTDGIYLPADDRRRGARGERIRIECPLCGRRICILYCVDGRVACRRCNSLWYAAQRASAKGRKFRAMKNVRRKLGDNGQLWAVEVPPKPRGMWRRTYARHCAALARIERKLFV
jgi:hypothetical protein